MRGTAIVVVNYGDTGLLEQNLVPLAKKRPDVGVVVVDNHTSPANAAEVDAICARHGWVAHLSPTNLGFGGGMNVGVELAMARGATRLLLLNPDATMDEESLSTLEAHVDAEPMVAVSPRVLTAAGAPWFDGAGLDVRDGTMVGPERLGEPDIEPWLSGAALMLATELWRRVGGFDDSYFLYWEDVDLSRRIREAGGDLRVVRDAVAVHDEGATHGTGGSRAKSDLYYYYNVRNRLRYAQAHLTPAGRRRWVASSPIQAREVLLRGGRRQFLESRSGLLAAAEGVRDGVAGRWGARGAAQPHDNSGTGDAGRPLRVLMTYMEPLPFHNPYVKMHDRSLEETGEVQVLHFDWRTALSGKYDVVHSHWPEDIFAATSPLKAAGKRVAAAMWLGVLAARRIPIVQTVHNLDLPDDRDPIKRAMLRRVHATAAHRILITDTTPKPDGPYSVVLHGHYKDWFGKHPHSAPVPGRIAYVGLVRRYKNVESLARVFAATKDSHPEWSLEIAGNPSSEELVTSISQLLAGDDRAQLVLRYLEDAEVVRVVTSAQLIVLPYKEMHNSGTVLTALSLRRPVLVPDNGTNRDISDEVGPGWVHTFEGDLSVDDLERAMAAVADQGHLSAPDLSRRDWDVSARGHLSAFRAVLAAAEVGR